jgi:sugar transferase (PEP-CTERM/EpsH1 system associated)
MRVLVLTHRLPYAPNRGDRIRSYHIVRALASRHDVSIVSLVHDDEEEAAARGMREAGVDVWTARVPKRRNLLRAAPALLTRQPLTHVLLYAPGAHAAIAAAVDHDKPDVVLAYCSGAAPFALTPLLRSLPLVVDMVDVDSAKWRAFGNGAAPPRSWIFQREARCLSRFERRIVSAARATTVVNERERDALLRVCPAPDVHVVPIGVDIDGLRPREAPSEGRTVVFTGVFNYLPNAEAAIWMARNVWPLVHAQVPDARLALVGSSPTAAVRALAADSSIEVTGSVPDVRPYLWRAAVAVAPIFTARGVQTKVLEAVAAGLPCVVTPAVEQGLPAEVLSACISPGTADAFARAVVEVLQMPPHQRRALAARADLRSLGWPERLAPLVTLVERAGKAKPSALERRRNALALT